MKGKSRNTSVTVLCTLLLCVTAYTHAQESFDLQAKAGILFLNTDPIGAEVIINGTPLVETTPVLLNDLDPGTYTVELKKEGYKSVSANVEVDIGKPLIRMTKLEYQYFKPRLMDEETIVFNGEVMENPEFGLRLDVGSYTFRRGAGGLFIDPVYPKQELIDALSITIPVLAILSGVLTVNDIIRPQTAGYSLSPSVVLSWAMTLSISAADLFLAGDKRSYMRDLEPVVLDADSSSFEAETYYERGERMLSMGSMNEAVEYYSVILHRFPDSTYVPEALYKIAKIHQITGETSMAAVEMQMILDSYPVPELYDKTCQNLAVLYFRKGDFQKSLTYLDAMVFIDPLFSREEVALYGSDILEVWSESTREQEAE